MKSNFETEIENESIIDNIKFDLPKNQYSECHSLVRNKERTIRLELENIGFSNEIINKAVDLHKKSGIGTRRGRKRKQTIFYYVYAAYNALNIPIEPKGLAERCGLKISEISRAIPKCRSDSNNVPNVVLWSPIQYIRECYDVILKKTDLRINFPENTLDDIIKMTEEIMRVEPTLLDQKPQTIAAAIVLYYLSINGININRKDFANLFKSSDMTINKIFKEVANAYNG